MRMLLGILIAATLAGPAHAAVSTPVTIKPGDYKLVWRDQAPFSYRAASAARDFRKMDAAETDRCPGLISKDTRITDGPVRLILDESNGTGTGYDTLYYVPPSLDPNTLDFSKAVKMAVTKSGKDPIVLKPVDFPQTLGWAVGEWGSRLLKSVGSEHLQAIFVRPNEDGTRRVTLGNLIFTGGWFGRIDSDHGPMFASLCDDDGDGIYGERVSNDAKTGDVKLGDVIIFGDEESLFTYRSRSMHSMYLGPIVGYDGKLYTVTVASNGETISIKPYDGDTGRLEIEALDSRGKPVECFGTYARKSDCLYAVHGSFGSDLPVGAYHLTRFMIGPDPLHEMDGKFRIYQCRDCRIDIAKGKTTTIKVGGVITLDIRTESAARILSVKRGQTLDMSVIPMIGKDRVEIVGDKPVSITVKDPNGRVVHTAAPEPTYHEKNHLFFDYSLSLPKEWKPGLYTMTATCSGKPYQDLITGTKLLNVTQ